MPETPVKESEHGIYHNHLLHCVICLIMDTKTFRAVQKHQTCACGYCCWLGNPEISLRFRGYALALAFTMQETTRLEVLSAMSVIPKTVPHTHTDCSFMNNKHERINSPCSATSTKIGWLIESKLENLQTDNQSMRGHQQHNTQHRTINPHQRCLACGSFSGSH